MATTVLPQLLEVDSELSAQVSALEAKLVEIQEKRKGIQTVIAMFESGTAPDIQSIAVDVKPSETAAKPAVKKSTRGTRKTKRRTASAKSSTQSTRTKAAKTKTAKTKTKAKPAAKSTARAASKTKAKAKPATAKKTKSAAAKKSSQTTKSTRKTAALSTASKSSAIKSTKSAKRGGRTANWQKYIKKSYQSAQLPDVIGGLLQAQPGNVFKIADVMNAVFKEDMPKTHFLKARNRISNILSAGARDGDWFRGRGGTYSMSEKAVKAVG